MGDRTQQPVSLNASVSARNLSKKELGAVIFGCTNTTKTECLRDQIFDLPYLHWSYVKNIQPRLPLFLFNYSDRKLHGIFEAASPGQLDINPYGWTVDGSEKTPYPAQVHVRVRKQCQPLAEEQYKRILVDNYQWESNHYIRFELDHAQTGKLISLFESLPTTTSFPYNAPIQRAISEAPYKNVRKNEQEPSKLDGSQVYSVNMWAALLEADPDANASTEDENIGCSTMTSGGDKKSEQQISESPSCMERMESEEERVYLKLKQISLERKSLNTSVKDHREEAVVFHAMGVACLKDGYFPVEPSGEENCDDVSETHLKDECAPAALSVPENWEDVSETHLGPDCSPVASSVPVIWEDVHGTLLEDGYSPVAPLVPANLEDVSETHLDGDFDPSVPEICENVSETHWKDDCSPEGPSVLENCEDALVTLVSENCKDDFEIHLEDDCSPEASSLLENCEDVSEKHLEDGVSPTASLVAETCQDISVKSDFQSEVEQLRVSMNVLKVLAVKQSRKTRALEKKLAGSDHEIQELKDQLKLLQSQFKDGYSVCVNESSALHDNETLMESFDESHLGMKELIFLMGGCDRDGSWLSTVECYSTSTDYVKCLAPMKSTRSYSSAAVSNGCIFNFGGCGDLSGRSWYDTVDCYNPWKREWIPCSPLRERKGSLACATFQDKIYAFGGGNEVGCSSKVEMFDPDLEWWIPIQSMLEKRVAAAAAELNGALYVVGGYNDGKYLKSTERFDPREVSWSRLSSMNSSRGSHSLAVLNEKIYALGGFDGTKMVSSVEIFDPRINSWILDDAMKQPRGYSFAPVIREKIYVIGGLKAHGTFANTQVECYKQGSGWSITNLKGIGERSFFSAVLL